MKTKILILSMFFLFSGKMKAENDLLTLNTEVLKRNIPDISRSAEDQKFSIVSFIEHGTNNTSRVKINCADDQLLKIRVFNMNGEMAREESYLLHGGESDFQFDFNNLPSGHYMVQFYTKDGSAVRRFIKM
ncbi:MAG: hypothetical protein JWN78_915 [Bacteroidota bacterium]|nr:hypothetical protein [Bacteroidota bacterium]